MEQGSIGSYNMGSIVSTYFYAFDTDSPTDLSRQRHAQFVGTKPNGMKYEHCPGFMITALQDNPDMIAGYRDIGLLEDGMVWEDTPERIVAEYIRRIKPLIATIPPALLPRIYFEGPFNEPGQLETKMAHLSRIEELRQTELNKLGARAIIGNFSAEARLYDKWEAFLPALARASFLGNLLGLHGYNSPTLQDGGASGNDVNDFLFPHRPLKKALRAAGYDMPRVGYTEFGIDRIIFPGTPQNPAKDFQGWLTTGCTAQQMVDQHAWANGEFRKDWPDVVFAATFMWNNQPGFWTAYNIRFPRQLRRGQFELPAADELLIGFMETQKGTVTPPIPPQPEPPIPVGDKFRVVVDCTTYLNLRAIPNGLIVGGLGNNTQVKKIEENGIWYKVTIGGEAVGWVSKHFLTPVA